MDFISKNRKLLSIALALLALIFVILAILNFTSDERKVYKVLYDGTEKMYSSYEDLAEKYEGYGYSSKANELSNSARDYKEKMDDYGGKLTTLNIGAAVYIILAVACIGAIVYLLKEKFIACFIDSVKSETSIKTSQEE